VPHDDLGYSGLAESSENILCSSLLEVALMDGAAKHGKHVGGAKVTSIFSAGMTCQTAEWKKSLQLRISKTHFVTVRVRL